MAKNGICTYTNDDLGKLVLRIALGVLMLFHGVAKLQNGIGGIEGMLQSNGLPAFIAYGVYLGEILAPIMLILGFRVKMAAVLILGTMAFILAFPYADKIFTITKHGAWAIELHMFYILGSIAIFLFGAGKYSIDKR